MGHAEMNGIRRLGLEQSVHGGIGAASVFFGHGLRSLRPDVGARDQLRIGQHMQNGRMDLSDPAAADDGSTKHNEKPLS